MADVKIEMRTNGPMRVYGPIDLVDQEGKNYTLPEGGWVTLCRCGGSANKPFCDGTHQHSGFQAPNQTS